MPPATMTSYSPSRISCAASAMASRPDRQTLLTVSAGTSIGDAGRDGGLPGGDLPGAGLQHLAHDHVLDLVRADPGPVQGPGDGDAAQFGWPLAGRGSRAGGRPVSGAADDDRLTWFAHVCHDTQRDAPRGQRCVRGTAADPHRSRRHRLPRPRRGDRALYEADVRAHRGQPGGQRASKGSVRRCSGWAEPGRYGRGLAAWLRSAAGAARAGHPGGPVPGPARRGPPPRRVRCRRHQLRRWPTHRRRRACGCSTSGRGTGPWGRRSPSCTRPIWAAC